jgi:hypothetical protein
MIRVTHMIMNSFVGKVLPCYMMMRALPCHNSYSGGQLSRFRWATVTIRSSSVVGSSRAFGMGLLPMQNVLKSCKDFVINYSLSKSSRRSSNKSTVVKSERKLISKL